MKKFFVILISLLCLSAMGAKAQVAAFPQGTEFGRKGTHLTVDGVKLDNETQFLVLSDVGGEDLNPQWKRYSHLRNTGLGLTIGGPVVAVFGAGYTMVYLLAEVFGVAIGAAAAGAVGGEDSAQDAADNVSDQIEPYINAGLIITGVGIGATVTGIVLLSTGAHKLKKTVNYINEKGESRNLTFDFDAAPSGVGFTLTF